MNAHRFLIAALVTGACAPEGVDDDGLRLLTPREQLIRASVDLRGVHPSEAELVSIDEHPGLYEDFVDRYLDNPRFLDRIEEVYNLRLLTRNGETYFDADEAGLGSLATSRLAASIADEPLKLVRHIVANDLPWTEIVKADFTMSDPILAAMWDLDYPADGEGWQAAWYRDGRPHAGILTMNTTWQRYPSMGGNANRHRANAVSKMLLCDDYLTRPIVLSRAAVDQLTIDPEEAITSETCQSCHSSLDPLAAHFYGFFLYEEDDIGLRAATTYRPENEEGWRDYANKPPGYFGRPTGNLLELADAVADDTRFADCAVQTVFEGFTQRTLVDADWEEIQAHRDVFLDADMRLRPLVRAIVTSRGYLAARSTDADVDDRLATVKTASPAQLASIIEDLTGYRWTFDGVDGMTVNDLGLPVLSGGVDSVYVNTPSFEPSVGLAFVQERLAWSAAYDAVTHDLDPERTDDARMLAYVTISHDPDVDRELFEQQIRALYLQITGLPLEDEATEPAALVTLWKQLYSVEASASDAWAGVVSAILRDPRVLFY